MPHEHHGSTEHELPVSPDLLKKMTAAGCPLADLATLSEAECRDRLQTEWAGLKNPANRKLADYLLSLPCLRISDHDGQGFRLVLFSENEAVWLPAIRHESPAPMDFPMEAVAGLLEFITHFGGLSDFCWVGGSAFLIPSKLRIMRDADKDSAWGPVQAWDGALVFYQGGTGDCIVVRRKGAVGKWCHDYANPLPIKEYRKWIRDEWPITLDPKARFEDSFLANFKDGPVMNLKCDFQSLVASYPEYCRMPNDSEAKAASPFFY